MDKFDSLNVWCGQRLVGFLWRNSLGHIGFRYDAQWLDTGEFPISQSLPLQVHEFTPESRVAHRYFANLLPEGRVRERSVRNLKVPDTDFDLLRSIGSECAGALAILQLEHRPAVEHKYREISDQGLADLIRSGGQVHSLSGSEHPRLSLAGTQDKCPILVMNDCYSLPKEGTPTSHILKFGSNEYRNVPAYETFTAMLAKAVGLPVVDTQLRFFSDSYYVLIERFDRYTADDGRINRLHQEDFCQALGYGFERKYQEYGGPSFADCVGLIREVSCDPATDLLNLLRWQIFNVLAGNSDGHAKNVSFLYQSDGEIRLAPFYDLVCTRAIEHIDHHLAFSVGGERNPDNLRAKHWNQFAVHCDLRVEFVRNQVESIAVKLMEQLQPSRERFESSYGQYDALQRVERVVTSQCRRTLRELSNAQ